ncbi:hypothetical protein ACP70R_006502 [Stipagrostis hirtigluma subsp. patula]
MTYEYLGQIPWSELDASSGDPSFTLPPSSPETFALLPSPPARTAGLKRRLFLPVPGGLRKRSLLLSDAHLAAPSSLPLIDGAATLPPNSSTALCSGGGDCQHLGVFVGVLMKGYGKKRFLRGITACRWYRNEKVSEIDSFYARAEALAMPAKVAFSTKAGRCSRICTKSSYMSISIDCTTVKGPCHRILVIDAVYMPKLPQSTKLAIVEHYQRWLLEELCDESFQTGEASSSIKWRTSSGNNNDRRFDVDEQLKEENVHKGKLFNQVQAPVNCVGACGDEFAELCFTLVQKKCVKAGGSPTP